MTPTIETIDISLNLTPEEIYAVLNSFNLPKETGRFAKDNYLNVDEETALVIGRRSLLTRQFANQDGADIEISNFVRAMVLLSHLPEQSMVLAINQREAQTTQTIEIHQRNNRQVMYFVTDDGVHQFVNLRNQNTILSTIQTYLNLPESAEEAKFSISLDSFLAIKKAQGDAVLPLVEETLSNVDSLPDKFKSTFAQALTKPDIALSTLVIKASAGTSQATPLTFLKHGETIMIKILEEENRAILSTVDVPTLSTFIEQAGFNITA